MAESFLTKVANDVLEASEKLSTRLEEGITALMTGELSQAAAREPTTSSIPSSSEEDMVGEFGEEEEGSPLLGIAESVIGDIMDQQARPESLWENIDAFRHAITWKEPFILSLLAFHFLFFLLCLRVSRKGANLAPRLVVIAIIAAIVRSAEYWNAYAAQHWREFATQNYFDQRGIFALTMVCIPLLLDSFIMLCFFLREAAQLLVQVKTAELKKKKLQKSRGENKKDQ